MVGGLFALSNVIQREEKGELTISQYYFSTLIGNYSDIFSRKLLLARLTVQQQGRSCKMTKRLNPISPAKEDFLLASTGFARSKY